MDKCSNEMTCKKLSAVLDDDHSRTRRIWFSSHMNFKTGIESTILVIKKGEIVVRANFCPFCGTAL